MSVIPSLLHLCTLPRALLSPSMVTDCKVLGMVAGRRMQLCHLATLLLDKLDDVKGDLEARESSLSGTVTICVCYGGM